MLPFAPTLAAHIRFLLHTLRPSNFHAVLLELKQIAGYGSDKSILLLQAFVDQVNLCDGDLEIRGSLFSGVIRFLMCQPNFGTVICEAFLNASVDGRFLKDLSKSLRLSTLEKITVGLALSDSENCDLRIQGQNFCIAHIEELCTSHDAAVLSEEVHSILMFLYQSQGFSKYVDSFTKMLSLVEQSKRNPCLLSPLLPDIQSLRKLDRFYDSCDNDFDTLLAEIERELSMDDVMKEIGYGCTINESRCKSILSVFSPLDELTLSRMVSTVVQTQATLGYSQNVYSTFLTGKGSDSVPDTLGLNSWNIDVLVASINQIAPKTNWISVMENLDHEGFYIPNERAFSLLMSIFKTACQDPFPLHVICGSVWKNVEGQLSFLKYAVSASPEIFTFTHSLKKLSVLCSQYGGNILPSNANEAWLCLDLIDTLCQVAERGYANSVREMIESPIKQYPETLLIGLAHSKTEFNFLQQEVSALVLPILLGSSITNDTLKILWNVNPHLLLCGFMNVQVADPHTIIDILDICLELKILSLVLDNSAFSFSIKLAAVASKRELINFDTWLHEKLNYHRDAFYEECLKFWREISADVENVSCAKHQHPTALGSIYADAFSTLMKVLQAPDQLVSDQVVDCESVCSMPFEGRLEDVETIANTFFKQIYMEELSIAAIIEILVYFKDSHVKRKKSIFEFIVSNILNEYEFYPKYPEKWLKIAAVLFGSVIKHKLVEDLILGRALLNVLDALCQPVDSKMFLFGVMALEQFVEHLFEWPQFCHRILQIPHFCSSQAELVTLIKSSIACVSSQGKPTAAEKALLGQNRHSFQENCESRSCGEVSEDNFTPHKLQLEHLYLSERRQNTSALASHVKPITSSLAVSPAISSKVPSSEIQEKIFFMTNNITVINAETKAKDFYKIVEEQYIPWFAQYMLKRASFEPSQHDPYLKFIDKVGSRVLNKEILKVTYASCKATLRSQLLTSSQDERLLLKNLGCWLGKLTIGKNQVLRALEINPKLLIIEAYEKGQMSAVIPFILKILEACRSSIVFQPPNAWTMGILQLLVEVYSLPDLKTLLTMNIEILFKNLGVDMKEVRSSSLLKDRQRETEGNPGFSSEDMSVLNPQVLALFREWGEICMNPAASGAHILFMLKLQLSGYLKGDDMTDQFFCTLMEYSLAHCLRTEVANPSTLTFQAIDLCENLIVSVLKFCATEQTSTEIVVLLKMLDVIVRLIQRSADRQKSSFNPRPYFRLLVYLLLDLDSFDLDDTNFQILAAFANTFHALRPFKVPSFSFAWLELISHRSFMPKLLMNPKEGWPFLQHLLVELFKFMEPFLRSADFRPMVRHLYQRTIIVVLVLLVEFPEFLCYYHFSFCNVIPSCCIQLRNVILSATPPNMRRPNLSEPHAKVCVLSERRRSLHILSEVDVALKDKQMKHKIDDYLQKRQQLSPLLVDLKQKLLLPENEAVLAGTCYNIPLINSLVLYVGMQAMEQAPKLPCLSPQRSHSSHNDIFFKGAAMDIYKSLIADLDSEGRYLFLSAIANQLRYANNCTLYFSSVLRYLFAEAHLVVIREQITRVLLERLSVDPPHPWGIRATFIDLFKNAAYGFLGSDCIERFPWIVTIIQRVLTMCRNLESGDDNMALKLYRRE